MGYETTLEFFDVTIQKKLIDDFIAYVDLHKKDENPSVFHWMLKYLCLSTNEHGYLSWNLDASTQRFLTKQWSEPPISIKSVDFKKTKYIFVEFNPNYPRRIGKWYQAPELVQWLANYCSGGKIIQTSQEGDGALWGWEINKDSKYRDLGLKPCSQWRKAKPVKK